MKQYVRAVVGLTVALSLAGCTLGNYRVVRKAKDNGEVALVGLPSDARPRAEAYMASVCPTGYEVVEEGETVVGQNGSSTTQNTKDIFGKKQQETTTSTSDSREWRIKYQCKTDAPATVKAAPPAAPGAAPAPAPAATTPAKSGKIHELVITF